MAGSIEIDGLIIEHAVARGGICRRSDLLAAGLNPGVIDRRVRVGFLTSIGRGIYHVEHLTDVTTPLHRALNLVPNSVVSHSTAAELHGFPVEPSSADDPVHVIAPNGFSRRIDGITVHPRRQWPHPSDMTSVGGVAMTGPAQTIVDLAARVGEARLRHIIQTQVAKAQPTMVDLKACSDCTARRGVNGTVRFRRVLRTLQGSEPLPQSALERQLAELLNVSGIKGFRPQYRPPWYDGRRGIVDFARPDLRLILEADGRRWHRRDQDMTEDRRRDRRAARNGWLTIRVTWAEVNRRPAATAADIDAIVSTRSSRSNRSGRSGKLGGSPTAVAAA